MAWMAWKLLLRPSLTRALGCFITEEMRGALLTQGMGRDMIYTWYAGSSSSVDCNTPCVRYSE